MHRENTAPRNSENSQTTTGSAEGPPLPSLKRSRVLSSCDSERSAGPDVSGSISWGSEARFSWRNNGPVRRVKRNVKWAFQLESFPAPDFQKRRPVFGLGVQVKGILKRSVATVSNGFAVRNHQGFTAMDWKHGATNVTAPFPPILASVAFGRHAAQSPG